MCTPTPIRKPQVLGWAQVAHPSNPHRPCRSHQAPAHSSLGLSHPHSPGLRPGTWGHRLIHRESAWPGDMGSWSSLGWPGTGPGALGQERGKCELVHLHAGPLESSKGTARMSNIQTALPSPPESRGPEEGKREGLARSSLCSRPTSSPSGEQGQPELFTLGSDTRRKAVRCLPGRHGECGLLSRQLVSPAPPQHCTLPVLQSPDGSPGTTGLPLPCDRLTSRKRDKAQALWPHPLACEGPSRGFRSPGLHSR